MGFQITTPAILFPAISLMLLAFGNRFATTSSLIRELKEKYDETHNESIIYQIQNLRKRVFILRNMQLIGIGAIFMCVLSMLLVYQGHEKSAAAMFGVSLVTMLVSLGLSIREIMLSTTALNLELKDIEEKVGKSDWWRIQNNL
jgi:ABC-type Fe3+-siderophore transport system permease subunit